MQTVKRFCRFGIGLWLFFFLGTASVQAQDAIQRVRNFQIGFESYGSKDLSEQLRQQGWADYGNRRTGIGIGLQRNVLMGERTSFLFSTHGTYFWPQSNETSSLQHASFGGAIGFGFNLINYETQFCVLGVQIGGMGQWLRLNNDSEEMRFWGTDPVQADSWEGYISGSLYYDIGLQWMQVLQLGDEPKGMTWGLSFGYRLNSAGAFWNNPSSDDIARGVPAPRYRGFYIQLSFGRAILTEEGDTGDTYNF